MYSKFYGFRENPFSLLPDPDFLYLSEQHERALNLLQLAAINRSGFCAISGAPGTGKSTLIRALLSSLDDNVCPGLITDTYSNFSELLSRILIAFDLDCPETDDVSRYKCFTDFVIHQYAANQNVLLIVDEAQNLEAGVLEQLRMLSNINADKNAMIQIMLIGQESLQEKLESPHLKQLAQRIECNHQLLPLDANETGAYIRHRIAKAGGSAELFSDEACELIHIKSDGIPRNINRICDLSLVYGYAADEHTVSADIVTASARKQFADAPGSPPAQHDVPAPVPAPAVTPVVAPALIPAAAAEPADAPKSVDVPKPVDTPKPIEPHKPVEPPAQAVELTGTSDTIVEGYDIADKQSAMAEISAKKSDAMAQLALAIESAQTTAQQSESLSIAAQKADAEHAGIREALSKHTEDYDQAIQQLESSQADIEKISAEKTEAEQTAEQLEQSSATTQQRILDEETAITEQLEDIKRADLHAVEATKAAALEAKRTLQERIEAERVAAELLVETESAAKQARKTLLEAESQTAEKTAALRAEAEKTDTDKKLAIEAVQHKTGQLLTANETLKQAEALALKLEAEKDKANTTVEKQAKLAQDISAQAAQAETAAQQAEEARLEAEHFAATQATAEKVLAADLADNLARIARQEADQAAANKAAALRLAQEKEDLARSAAEQAAKAKAEADLATGAEIRILMDNEEERSAEDQPPEENSEPSPAPVIPKVSPEELNTVTRLAAEARSRQKRKHALSLIAASAAGILLISWATFEINKPDEIQSAKVPVKTEAAALELLKTDTTSEN